jgi:hypothetical protein
MPQAPATDPGSPSRPPAWTGQAVEFDPIVPASGNLGVAGKQFWLGPAKAGVTVTFWADSQVIHLLIAGTRVKSLRSHLSTRDLDLLAACGGRPAGPPPLPPADRASGAVEVDRTVNASGLVSLAGRQLLAAEILAGRRVTIRLDGHTLQVLDLDSRELLRTHPNPLTAAQAAQLHGTRPGGPPPRPSQAPVRVQRRVASNGVVMVAGQRIALGRTQAGQVVTVHATDTTLTIDLGDDTTTIRRTTTQPVRSIKAHRPRKAGDVS